MLTHQDYPSTGHTKLVDRTGIDMVRALIHHVVMPSLPAVMATVLGWPDVSVSGRAALVATIIASALVGAWHLTRKRRRDAAIDAMTQQIEQLVDSENLSTWLWSCRIDGELHELNQRLTSLVACSATAMSSLKTAAEAKTTLESNNQVEAARRRDQNHLTSLQSISVALAEMTAIVTETAQSAADANDLAHGAETSANNGSKSMHRLVEAMGEIETSSTEISRIIKVIDDIAFQTNLLALNAAVEAARAGEAARNTSALIAAASQRAQRGSQLSHEVDRMLGEIRDATTRFTSLVAQIATSTREQSHGIQQVTQSVTELQAAAVYSS